MLSPVCLVCRVGPSQYQSVRRHILDYFADKVYRAGIIETTMLPIRSLFPIRHIFMAPIFASEPGVYQRIPYLVRSARNVNNIDKLGVTHRCSPQLVSSGCAERSTATAQIFGSSERIARESERGSGNEAFPALAGRLSPNLRFRAKLSVASPLAGSCPYDRKALLASDHCSRTIGQAAAGASDRRVP